MLLSRGVYMSRQKALARDNLGDGARNPLAQDSELPLLGKRIMVTAPRQYAQKLCSKLINAGARAIWIPGVKITDLTDTEGLRRLDHGLNQLLEPSGQLYTHVAFTSKNGIYATLNALARLTGGLPEAVEALRASGARLCALGADGDVLQDLGLPLDISPPEASTLGLVRELVARGEAAGASVLCPVPLVTGGLTEPAIVPRFLQALSDAGAAAHRLDAYVTSLGATPRSCAAEADLLLSGAVDAIAFSSTAEAQGLLHILGGRQVFTDAVVRHQVLLAAHGPYTAAGASQVLGLPIQCVSEDFRTFDGLVAALESGITLLNRPR